MVESHVPYGLHKYIDVDWVQCFSKSTYNMNTKNSTGMPERQSKKKNETGVKTLFKRPFQSSSQI